MNGKPSLISRNNARSPKQQLGDHYENQACCFLTRQGLRLLAKNVRFDLGELDLVMQDKNCLVFIEVKFRRQARFGGAAAAISASKQRRLLKSAYLWLEKQGLNANHTEFRFDAVTFDGPSGSINWIKNMLIEG